MTKKRKLILVGMGIFISLMILVPVGLLFYLETDHAQGIIQTKINNAIPGTVSWEKFRFSLLRGRFELKNVLLRGPSDDKLAGFDRLFIDCYWPALFHKELVVSELTLKKPNADLRVNKEGKLNLTDAFPPPKKDEKPKKEKGKLPLNILVSSLNIVQGSVQYEMAAKNMKAGVQGFDLTVTDANLMEQSGNLALEIGKANIASPKIQKQVNHIQLKANLREQRIDPLILKLETRESALALSGSIQDILKDRRLNLTLDLKASLAEIRENLQLKQDLTGQAALLMTVQGTANNPDASLRLDYGGGNLAGNQIDGIDLDCQLKDRTLNLDNLLVKAASGYLNLQGNVDLQNAFANGFLAPEKDLEVIAYDLTLKGNQLNLEELSAGKKNMKGLVNSDISVQGKGISPKTLSAKVMLSLTGEQLSAERIATPIDLNVNAEAQLEHGLVVTVKALEAKAGEIHLQTDGYFNLNSQKLDADILLDAPNLAANLQALGIKDVHGNLKLDANVSGSVKQPIFDCALTGEQLRFQDITIGNIALNAASDPSGMVRVSKLDIRNQGAVLQGKGSVQVFQKDSLAVDPTIPLNFSLILRDVDPKKFYTRAPVSGKLKLDASVSGSVKQPILDLSLRGDQLRFKEITIGDVGLDATSDPSGNVKISNLGIENQGSVLQASGSVRVFQKNSLKVDPAMPLSLSILLRNIEPKDFLSTVPADLTADGKIDLGGNIKALSLVGDLQAKKLTVGKAVQAKNISVSADFKDVTGQKGTVSIHGKHFDFGVQKVREIKVDARLDGKDIGIDSLQIVLVPGATIEGTGKISLPNSYQVNLASKGINLESIDKVRDQKIAKGKILFDISGKGTFKDPQLEGDIAVKNLRVKGNPVDDFQIHVAVQENLARVSGKLNFDLDASYHLQKKDFAAMLRFDKTDLGPYLKLADQTDLAGMLTGKIQASGNAGTIDKVQANADLSELNLLFKKKEIVSSKGFKASFRNGKISIPGSQLRLLNDGHLEISGQGKPAGPFDFRLKGNIPLQLAAQFTDAVPDITGNINLSANIKGSPSKPDLRADIELKNVGMTVPGLLQQLHDVNGQIQVTPKAVVIKGIKGQLDSGQIDLSGKIDLKAFKPVRMTANLKTNALPINVPDTLDIVLSTDLQVSGTPEKSMVTGEAVILEGRYYKDVDLSLLSGLKSVAQKKRETAPQSSKSAQPFLKNMELDISVKRRNPFLVENNLALLDINPDLRIYGKADNPLISGRAGIESGTITYQKKDFEVKKGIIDFLNPYKIEPTLDIESEISIREWAITLKVSGMPDALDFQLTSNPQEEHGDILSLLVMGKTTYELGKSEGGTSQFPTQMLADIVENTFGDDIKKATGLDILKVEFQDDENTGDSDRVKVTLGKELSRRMTVKYAMESKNGEMVQKGIAEYKFLENMMLTGFQDSKGTFGGELRYRLEW